jgi:hypothetical protein
MYVYVCIYIYIYIYILICIYFHSRTYIHTHHLYVAAGGGDGGGPQGRDGMVVYMCTHSHTYIFYTKSTYMFIHIHSCILLQEVVVAEASQVPSRA